nr:alpha/beta hydrolase [Candidatus Sigynarchaeota archaeon]
MRIGTGEKHIIYLVGGGGLINDISSNAIEIYKSKKHLVSKEFKMHVLGYPRELPWDFTIESLAQELAGVIRSCIGKGILVGSSFGGTVALPLTTHNPDLFSKLVLTSSACDNTDTFKSILRKLVDSAENGKKLQVLTGVNILLNKRSLRVFASFATIVNWHKIKDKINLSNFSKALKMSLSMQETSRQHLPNITVETFILGGTRDIVHSVDNFKETASLIPRAMLVLLEGCGHEMPTENKKTYARALKRILEK